jgi:3-deoxy-D-manno-octulosonate cytidylyltransferase
MKKCIGLIPSRQGSTRLPRKPLLEIDGLPMIVHTLKRTAMAKSLDDCFVCTDSEQIREVVELHGGKAIMTSSVHHTGTDRIAEAAADMEANLFVDVQGDEPLVNPEHIDAVVAFHQDHPEFDIVVPSLKLESPASPHIVKIIATANGRVLYFTRGVGPFPFKKTPEAFLKHLSIITFKPQALFKFGSLPMGELEAVEGVELMRALENDMTIGTLLLTGESQAVDIEEHYEIVKTKILIDRYRSQY